MNSIEKIYHPKNKELNVDIVQAECDTYYFDIDGDWYNETWIANPLEECKKDAMGYLEQIYKGTYYEQTKMEASEAQYRGYF